MRPGTVAQVWATHDGASFADHYARESASAEAPGAAQSGDSRAVPNGYPPAQYPRT